MENPWLNICKQGEFLVTMLCYDVGQVAQAAGCLTMRWTARFVPGCRRGGDFSSRLLVPTRPGVHSDSYKMSTGGGEGGRA